MIRLRARGHTLVLLAAVALSVTAPPAGAIEGNASEIEALDALLAEGMAEVDAEERMLQQKVKEIERDQGSRQQVGNRVEDLTDNRGAGDSEVVPDQVGEEQRIGREQAQQSTLPDLPRISYEVGGVLTPKGRLIAEPYVRYQHSSVNRVSIEGLTILPALLIGVIDVVEADRDTYTAALTGRYGVTNRFETALSVPFLWRTDSARTRKFLDSASQESTVSGRGSGLGDIEFGMRYQFNNGQEGWPYMVGNLRVKSATGTDPFELSTKASLSGDPQLSAELPTGSGFWSINPSMTFIYPSDPVVFFGNAGYLWTLADDKGTFTEVVNGEDVTRGFGEVDPGDALRLNFGMGIGMNERTSLSFSYSLDLFNETRIENSTTKKIAGSDVTIGRLLLGFSLRSKNSPPLNLAIGIGATEDAPDTDLTFQMPFNFFK